MYQMKDLISKDKFGTQVQKVSVVFNVNATESSALAVSGKVTNITGVTALNPILVKVYHSFCEDNFVEVEANTPVALSDTGYFVWNKKPSQILMGPRIKVELTIENPAEFLVTMLKYSSFDESDSISFQGGDVTIDGLTVSTGFVKNSIETNVIEDTVEVGNSVPLPVKILDGIGNGVANYGAVNTVSKFPMNSNAVTFEYPSDVIEIVKYRTGGVAGTVVQTQTITYADASKERIVSILLA